MKGDNDLILVPRDILAATSYMLRKGSYAESNTAAKIYALAVSDTGEGRMPHGLRELSDTLMSVARRHFYFNQAAEVLHNMENHLCAMAALYEQQHDQHAEEQGDTMHASTFEYLKPTDKQMKIMDELRAAAKDYCDVLEAALPDGPDKTFILRAHRQNAMWVNVAITRQPDGAPRSD